MFFFFWIRKNKLGFSFISLRAEEEWIVFGLGTSISIRFSGECFFGLAEERANLSEEICMWGWVIDWLSIHCHRRSCLSTMEKTKRYRSVCFSTSLFSVLLFQYRLFHLILSVSRWHQMVCWVTERSREREWWIYKVELVVFILSSVRANLLNA